MKEFPFIDIENKLYPSVIMGEDHFTGWFNKCKKYDSDKEREIDYRQAITTAYSKGVRGFSMSPHPVLIKVLREFKMEFPDIVCIANPSWQKSYYIGNESLWIQKNLKKLSNYASLKIDQKIKDKCYWFERVSDDIFSSKEIANFRLDSNEHKSQLIKFKDFCDFCLVGNLGISSLVLHNRIDIIEKEIQSTRELSFIPLLMCEGGGLSLPTARKLDVAGSWLCINRSYVFPNFNIALKTIKDSTKPITAYKILTSPEGFDLEKSISFIKSFPQIKSIVVGVDGKDQAEDTFSNLHYHWN